MTTPEDPRRCLNDSQPMTQVRHIAGYTIVRCPECGQQEAVATTGKITPPTTKAHLVQTA